MSYTPPAANALNFAFGVAPNGNVQPMLFPFGTGGALSLFANQYVIDAVQVVSISAIPSVSSLQATQTAAVPQQQATLVGFAQVTAAQTTILPALTATMKGIAALVAAQTVAPAAQACTFGLVAKLVAAQAMPPVAQSVTLGGLLPPDGLAVSQTTQQAAQVVTYALLTKVQAAQITAPGTHVSTFGVLAKLAASQNVPPAAQSVTLDLGIATSRVQADQMVPSALNAVTIHVTPLGPLSLVAVQLVPTPVNTARFGPAIIDRIDRTFFVAAQRRGYIVEPQTRELEMEL